MGQLGGGSAFSANCVPHCTQIKFSMAILSGAISNVSVNGLSPALSMRSAIVAPAHELHRMRMRRRKVSSNRKRVGNQARLLAFVASECADSGACAGVASSVCDFAAKERAQSWLDESPCAHVLRFFLAPHERRALWKPLEHFAQPFFCKWVQLLDANERCVVNLALGAIFQQIVIHFARAKDDPLYLVGGTSLGRAENFLEPTMDEFFRRRRCELGAQ